MNDVTLEVGGYTVHLKQLRKWEPGEVFVDVEVEISKGEKLVTRERDGWTSSAALIEYCEFYGVNIPHEMEPDLDLWLFT